MARSKEKWEDRSWQLKRYVQRFAKLLIDAEGSERVTADDLSEAFDVQQTGTQHEQLYLVVACMLAH